MSRSSSTTDLTDPEWELVAPCLYEGHPPTRWERVWVDGGYENRIEDWVAEQGGWQVEVVKRPDGKRGWVLLPKRWVVERTFAWLGRWRGLAREHNYEPESTEADIRLVMIHL